MSVNIYEKPRQPIVDLDSDVIVYVPGYAYMGPSEPTLVNADTFTSIFGASPYKFRQPSAAAASEAIIDGNAVYPSNPEKSWLFAKGLVDAGLTVLYHRCNPLDVPVAEIPSEERIKLEIGGIATMGSPTDYKVANTATYIGAKAKFFGGYYRGIKLTVSQPSAPNGINNVVVKDSDGNTLEEHPISMNPNSANYIGVVEFTYIDLYPVVSNQEQSDFASLDLEQWYSSEASKNKAVYLTAGNTYELKITNYSESADEFTVQAFQLLLKGKKVSGSSLVDVESPLEQLKDTELYESITYLTTGGYYQDSAIWTELAQVAYDIKAMALVADHSRLSSEPELRTVQANFISLSAYGSKATTFAGADTFTISGYRVILPDAFGYLQRLGINISKSIPPWIPVANNPQGVVSAIATTRSIGYAVRSKMITDEGVSINPIIYKPNTGFTIMGNRTLFATAGVASPESYLNCQLVVNTIARSARRAANRLLIVSTNAQTAFSNWKSAVSKTCDKMLVNGDGLASYSIIKLKKTKPATIDVVISLQVVEGLETFNITLDYSLNMEA